MFDPFFSGLAWVLAFFYDLFDGLVGNNAYALAIVGLTLTIMIVFTPLTIKGTRSMMQMSTIQPEIKRLQALHRGDRQKLNEEMMKLYQANGVNPLGGCLPTLVQIPIFFVLYRVVRGLTAENTTTDSCAGASGFCPQYLNSDSQLYQDLVRESEMRSFGMDLARSANDVLRESFVDALPYLALILVTFGLAWFQQRQMKARRVGAATPNRQMEVMMKVLPFMLPVFSFLVESALAVYFVASSLYRIGQQAYIHRSLSSVSDTGPSLIDVEATSGTPPGGSDKPAEPERPDIEVSEVVNERSRKARDAEQQRLAERAARSAARRVSGTGGEIGTARVPKPRQAKPRQSKHQNHKSNSNNSSKTSTGKKASAGEKAGNGISKDTVSDTEATAPTNKGLTDKPRRRFFGRGTNGQAAASNNGKETPKPIQSRRTAGDGRKRKKR